MKKIILCSYTLIGGIMKKSLKIFGIITLICFSFFYTDKVMMVVSEKDPLKMEIVEVAESYKIFPNEAIVTNDTIIPGTNGKVVNIDKSYKKMRKGNIFNINLLEYDILYPEYTLSDNLDKYVIKGNNSKKEVSILFIINSNNNLDKIMKILDKKNVVSNLFIDYVFLNNNITQIKTYNKHNIYSYQDGYTHDTLVISNNIIKRISNTNPIYCLTREKNDSTINVCSYSNMNTIIPSINGNLNDIKRNLENGSIILFDTGVSTVSELSYIIDFITGKGYNIVGLDKLLSENV